MVDRGIKEILDRLYNEDNLLLRKNNILPPILFTASSISSV